MKRISVTYRHRCAVQFPVITGNGKLPVRIGYMGAGMILAAHWTLEPLLFIGGFSCVLVQVSYRKQWNLVALNINGLIAWIIHYLN